MTNSAEERVELAAIELANNLGLSATALHIIEVALTATAQQAREEALRECSDIAKSDSGRGGGTPMETHRKIRALMESE